MKILLFSFSIMFLFNISVANNILEISKLDGWELLESNEVTVSYQYIDNIPYCKASTIYNIPSHKIKNTIEDLDKYAEIFKRMKFCNHLTEDIVHIQIDLPFPFYDRDYIVKHNHFKIDDSEYYMYTATTEKSVPLDKNSVRLYNASGIWKIDEIDVYTTKLTYTWNGELKGNIPNWALNTAWSMQGKEILNWIKEGSK